MKLLKTRSSITEEKGVAGLLACTVEHEIKQSKGFLQYNGPKIDPQVWQQVLSFFKWTYDTTQSESQVRLYVNPGLGIWRAWAYPQEAHTGMSAKELDTPEGQKQREQFKDTEGWIYLGTVHHHCSAGAFQSGTDEANETRQDGLHITVGNMDQTQHSLHGRFYRSQLCFEPELVSFWDIGEPYQSMPDEWVNKEAVAHHQMGEASSIAFPDEWRANLINKNPPPSIGSALTPEQRWSLRYEPGLAESHWPSETMSPSNSHTMTEAQRLDEAVKEALGIFEEWKMSDQSFAELEELLDDPVLLELVDCCVQHRVELGDLMREVMWERQLLETKNPAALNGLDLME